MRLCACLRMSARKYARSAIEESETTSDSHVMSEEDDHQHFIENGCVNCYFYTRDSLLVGCGTPSKLEHFNSMYYRKHEFPIVSEMCNEQ